MLQKTTATLPGTYSLKVDPTVTPLVHGPRCQPQALAGKIKAQLYEVEENGHIARVSEPTDWVSSMVTVYKNGKVRICIDPKDLNRALHREHYPIPTVEEVVVLFPKAKVFSVLDSKSGFLQIKLDYESSLLTTFNTPQGRYCWLRLPFGVKSAPEIFQKAMDRMLEGIEEAKAIMDNILVGGRDVDDHDRILQKLVDRATQWSLSMNFDKCQIRKNRVSYVGHMVTEHGLEPSRDKVRALTEMPAPISKEEVRRFLGMIQYLDKFIPDLSAKDAPLRQLLKKEVGFHWSRAQQESFRTLKDCCSKAPVLARYDKDKLIKKKTKIMCNEVARSRLRTGMMIDGEQIEEVTEYKYLGRLVTSGNDISKEIPQRLTSGWRRFKEV